MKRIGQFGAVSSLVANVLGLVAVGDLLTINLNRMTRQELELKAREFESNLKNHPMSNKELQNVLCCFVEALRIPDVVGQGEQLPKPCNCDCATNGSKQDICDGECMWH